jgi:hypothetical protein
MSNNYQYYKTLTDKELEKEEDKQLTLGIYSIKWGRGNSFTWVCQEQDEKQEIENHHAHIIGVTKLVNKEYKQHFLTIDLEHVIHVSSNKDGKLVKKLTGHTGRILGVIELSNGNLLSVSLDGSIKHWDMSKYQCIATIEANISSFDDIDFANSTTLITKDKSATKLWEFTGKLLVELIGFTKPIEYIRRFESNIWIVKPEGENPSKWSLQGELLYKYKFSFSPRTDVLELDNLQLLIKDSQNVLQLWSKEGELLEKHIKDNDITAHFEKLLKANEGTDNWIGSHSSSDDYPLTCNFGLGDYELDNGKSEIEKQEIKFNKKSGNRTIWDFFYRPVERRVKTALKENIDIARKAEEALALKKSKAEKEIEQHGGKLKFAKFIALFFFCLSLIIGGIGAVGLILTDNFDMIVNVISPVVDNVLNSKATLKNIKLLELQILFAIGAGSLLFLSLLWFIRNRRQKRKQAKSMSNLVIIETVLHAYHNLISAIKTYRSEILNSLPSHQDEQLFTGDKVNKLINDKIENEIQQFAMERCNVKESDITYQRSDSQKCEAIICQEWSLMQENKHRRLNKQNEQAFRFDSNSQPVFAVRFIQYIFLTQESVAVFSTYYDFITDKYIGRQSSNIFYKDVVNVGTQDVEREGLEREFSGIEMTLFMSNGGISLTFINDESIRSLSESTTENNVHDGESATESTVAAVEELLGSELTELQTYYQTEIAQVKEGNNSQLIKDLEVVQKRLQCYLEEQIDMTQNYKPDDSVFIPPSKDGSINQISYNINAQIQKHKKSDIA